MSRELSKRFPNGLVHQVDMFSGELTELMEGLNFLRHQPKTVIPPKQTAKSQWTDIHFARVGKAAGQASKSELRRHQRRKAQETGVAAKLEAGPYECVTIMLAMHKACVEAAKQGKVEETARKGGWFAYEATQTGIQKAEGERWEGLPLGGSNLSQRCKQRLPGPTSLNPNPNPGPEPRSRSHP